MYTKYVSYHQLCFQLTGKFLRIQKAEIKDLIVILLGQPYSMWGRVLLVEVMFLHL